MIERYKIVAAVVFIIAIVFMVIILVSNKDSFIPKYNMTYPDGCQEAYVGHELVSKECTAGRLMVENAKREKEEHTYDSQWTPKLEINLSLN